VFAGEEDPYWLITKADDIAMIQRSLQDLPHAAQPDWPTLGWRGFRLSGLKTDILPPSARVFNGTICFGNGDEKRCYKDQHKLEAWLQSEARRQGLGRFISPSR
jgi:hypothetical protein